jgi:hypothetical protein
MRRLLGCAALVLATALLATGCGSRPELDTQRAHTLQQSVLGVTQAAADGRWADAQTLLETTRTQLDAGADAGEVSTTRYRRIDSALDAVQSELAAEQERAAAAQAATDQAAQPAVVTPSPTAVDTPATPPKGKTKHPPKGKGGK